MSTLARIGTGSLAVLLLVAAAGCGTNSFVGQRYDNFTAYYNTFYNALNAYEQGVEAMESSNEPIDRTHFLSVFGNPRAGGNVSFQNAIDKSADLLRRHPDSKWVDDALFLIGKSYFYQGNYVGAEQKFREVIELTTNLEDESRIWLARTLIAAGAYDDARAHLVSSLEQEDVSERWAPRLHIALGELYVRREAYEDAALELEAGLEGVRDSEIKAKAAFLLGQVYEMLEQYEDAVRSYRDVRRAHPRYQLSYAANLSAVRIQGLYLDADEALNELRRLERDDKNYSNRHELAYVRGRTYQEQGRAAAARSLYREILYDPEAQIGDLRGRLHYALAELYRDAFRDYTVAAAHFDSARTSLASTAPARASGNSRHAAPEAITDVEYLAEVFGSFAEVRTRIARMDSLMELGALDADAFQERILEIRRQRAAELAEQQRRAEQMQAERGFQDAASRSSSRTPSEVASENTGQAGFLSHRDPIRVQEARMNFIITWGERPRVPNWRRSEAIAAAAGQNRDEQVAGMRGVDPGVGENALPPLDYSDVPRDSLSRARMLAERALARYELGNVLFLSMNRPDSAASWYRMVVEEDAGEEVAQRAFYALAEVQRSLGDTAAANRLYEQVLRDFPSSDFAERVRDRMGISRTAPTDSLAAALAEYDAAFKRWRDGFYRDALDSMAVVAARHPGTDVAAKALLAAGRIYLEWADADSMDLFAPLPFSVSDSVLHRAGLLADRRPLADGPADTTAWADPEGEIRDGDTPRRRIEPVEGAGDRSPPEERRGDEPVHRSAPDTTVADSPDGSAADTPVDADTSVAAAPAAATPVDADTSVADTSAAVAAVDADTSVADTSAAVAANRADLAAADTSEGLIASAEGDLVYLQSLYASVRDRYPATPYAEQASSMLDALEQRLREMQAPSVESPSLLAATAALGAIGSLLPDSLLGPAADTTAADMTAADTTAADIVADTTAADAAHGDTATAMADVIGDTAAADTIAAGSGVPSALPSGRASVFGEGGIRPELGGFTIILSMSEDRASIEELAARYARQGFRSDVLDMTFGGTTLYRAAVGHFSTHEAASEALQEHGDEFDQQGQVAPLAMP